MLGRLRIRFSPYATALLGGSSMLVIVVIVTVFLLVSLFAFETFHWRYAGVSKNIINVYITIRHCEYLIRLSLCELSQIWLLHSMECNLGSHGNSKVPDP